MCFFIYLYHMVSQNLSWQISSQFFDYSWQLWQRDAQSILHGFSAVAQSSSADDSEMHNDLYLTCQRWFLCSKIIRQLIIAGFPGDAKTMQVSMQSNLLFLGIIFSLQQKISISHLINIKRHSFILSGGSTCQRCLSFVFEGHRIISSIL